MKFWDLWNEAQRRVEQERDLEMLELEEENFAAMADVGESLAAAYASLRANFIAVGFSEEQAGDLVVAMRQEAAADALAVANGFVKPE